MISGWDIGDGGLLKVFPEEPLKADKMIKQPALDLWRRAQESVVDGVSCPPMHPRNFAKGILPTHITRAKGCSLWSENRQYMDFVSAGGECLFGYANETINRAAWQAMQMGPIHSLPTHYEILAAEKVKEIWPFVDKVIWVNSISYARAVAASIGCEMIDEVEYGYLFPKLTYCAHMGLQPQVVIGGGKIANGFPIYFVGLKAGVKIPDRTAINLIDREDIPSTTAFAALHAGLTMLQTKKADIVRLIGGEDEFITRFNTVAGDAMRIGDADFIKRFFGSPAVIAYFMQESAKAGLIFGETFALNFAHLEPGVFDAAFTVIDGIFHKINTDKARLEIDMPAFCLKKNREQV